MTVLNLPQSPLNINTDMGTKRPSEINAHKALVGTLHFLFTLLVKLSQLRIYKMGDNTRLCSGHLMNSELVLDIWSSGKYGAISVKSVRFITNCGTWVF